MKAFAIARLELLIARRNMWVATSVILMALFTFVLTLAGGAPTGTLGADPLTVAATSVTTLSVYLIPLIGLLLSFDAIAGEAERGTLALGLTYPLSRREILLGKFAAHLAVLAFAVAIGLLVMVGLILWRHGGAGLSPERPMKLFATSLALGASFLGIGYFVSALVRRSAVASGIVILIWLVCIVLYDLGLLGILIADEGGTFTKDVFPWLLAANPADAFRLINMPAETVSVLSSDLGAAGSVVGTGMALASLMLWPLLTLFAAWLVFRRLEP